VKRPLEYARDILALSWPILLSQFVILGSRVTDTIMAGHFNTIALAAIGVGSSIWLTLLATSIGVLQGLGPIAARATGAERYVDIGEHVRHTAWIALAVAVPGILVLQHPEGLLAIASVPAEVRSNAAAYLGAMAWGLPAALLVYVFYVFTPSVGLPRPVMIVNVVGLAVKLPFTYALVYGRFGFPALGTAGCALGSALMYWCMFATACLYLWIHHPYHRFAIGTWTRPRWSYAQKLLRLGLPIALSSLIEVGSFTFMALFVARLGADISAAHQILSSLAVILFMVPRALSVGIQAIVGQALGREDSEAAAAIAALGLRISVFFAIALGTLLLILKPLILAASTSDAQVAAIAGALFPILALYHIADASQAVAVSALRAYQRTILPMFVYLFSLWGIGLAGGWMLTFRGLTLSGFGLNVPPLGLAGMWVAATLSLVAAVSVLVAFLRLAGGFETRPQGFRHAS
jgi:MATE family multidrug resistance protein